MAEFEPKIVAFLCNWCAYAGADLAGVSRLQYPANMRTVRVMCSGRVDPVFITKAFREGCDGVLVSGWHFGDCHYLEGNVQAEKKLLLTRKLLDLAGIGEDRLHFAWVSSAEAQRFVEVVNTTTDSIKSQGPLDAEQFSMALEACEMTVSDETIRWLVGKEVKITKEGDVYGRSWDLEKYESVMFEELEREYQKNMIYLAIREGATSVREVSARIDVDLLRVSYLLADLERTNRVEFTGMQESKPVFAAL